MLHAAIHLAIWLPHKKHYVYVGNLPIADSKHILRTPIVEKDTIIHIPYFLLADFNEKIQLDLALNAWSFAEMPESEVKRYGSFIKSNLKTDGVLFEQNGELAHLGGCNTQKTLSEIFPCIEQIDGPLNGPIRIWGKQPVKIADTNPCLLEKSDEGPNLRFIPDHFSIVDKYLVE
jgi:hypothetical protein